MKREHIILLFLVKTFLCQDINKLFEDVNRDYGEFNSIAATLSWDSSVNPDNDFQSEAAKYQKELITWQQKTCDTFLALYARGLLNNTQIRQSYLLCRGPKFTYDEARLSSTMYEKLQSIYSNAEICIPTVKDIDKNDLSAIEAAILNYLTSVKINSIFESNDHTMHAVKLACNSGYKEGKVFCMRGENDFQRMMIYCKDEEVLRWLWLVWREKVGPPMKKPYKEFVEIENRASRRNGFTDIGSSWRSDLEIRDLRHVCRRLYENILPLYKMVHGVARFYLRKQYGEIVPERGPIPAHLLGDLWSQNWESLIDLILKDSIDLNYSIKEKNWTVSHMVKRAEDFYTSLGLPPMTETFWSKSVFERENNSLRCHGAAADMFKKGDFRMLYCLDVSMDDFYGLHHELGHIQYYMAYEHQPAIFRQANAAFHEALGDTIMLGVMTPQHLHRLGIINDKSLYTVHDFNKGNYTLNNTSVDTRYLKKNIRNKRDISCEDQENRVNEHDNENKESIVQVDKATYCCDERNDTKTQNTKVHNCKRCYFNNQLNTTHKLKRNKRIKRQKSEYQHILYNMSEIENINIDKSKQAIELIYKTEAKGKNHNVHKRSINTLYKERKGIALKPSQEIYTRLYPDKSDAIKLQRNDYTVNRKEQNYKDMDVNKDEFVKENNKERLSDNLLDNMKLDDILVFRQALNKLPQIPFALAIDEYRWKYFEGSLKETNGDFWKLALELQGIAPPGFRGEEYFDAGAKFHVPDNTPYIRYFLSSFLQHQLFETLCKAAVFGRRSLDEPLPETISMNRCDIYGSKTVGKILKSLMSRGNSRHWRDILEEVTGERDISSIPLQRYYRPLFEFLRTLVNKYRIPVGW